MNAASILLHSVESLYFYAFSGHAKIHDATGSVTDIKNAKIYRAEKKSWYMVARYFFLALLSFSVWPCPAVA